MENLVKSLLLTSYEKSKEPEKPKPFFGLKVGNKISLKDAEILSIKAREFGTGGSYRTHYGRRSYGWSAEARGVLVNDPKFGKVWFSTSSKFVFDLKRGDKVSINATVSGFGDPNPKYQDDKGLIFVRKPKLAK
jgi:hypothetical protein